MLDAYMYTGLRSPFGRHAGALAKLRPDDMLAGVVAKVVAESGFAPDKIEDVVVGCANQAGEDSRCVARHARLSPGCRSKSRARYCSATAARASTRSAWRRRRSPAARATCSSPAASRA